MSNTILKKINVCKYCFSDGITDLNCKCVNSRVNTVLLEFEFCKCCNNIISDGYPAETNFNKNQLKNISYEE